MNWKRGLFRLWATFSILWLIGIGILAQQDLSRPYASGRFFQYVSQTKEMPWDIDWTKPFYERSYAPGKGKYPDSFAVIEDQYLDGYTKKENNGHNAINLPDSTILYLENTITDKDQKYLRDIFWQQRNSRLLETATPWIIWAFSVPAVIFSLALIVIWILYGFRSKPS